MASTIQTNLANWSTTLGTNNPQSTDTADIDTDLRTIQMVVRQYLATKGADIASGATVNLAAATGNYVHVTHSTGTTAITSLGTVSAGMRFLIVFDVSGGSLSMTHSGSALILPTAANITIATGDRAEFVSLGSGNWRCLWYQPAAGYQPLDAQLTTIAGISAQQATDLAALSTFMGTVLNDTDAATARATLGVVAASATASGIVELATPAECVTGTDTARAATPEGVAAAIAASAGLTTLGTAAASTSGATIDFAIPSTAKHISVMFNEVSTNTTDLIIIQLGDAGGFEATNYLGGSFNTAASSANSTGFDLMPQHADTALWNGLINLDLMRVSDNLWAESGCVISSAGGGYVAASGGTKALSQALTHVRITTVGGAGTFDSGVINVSYQS